ncbi:alpha-glucosidase [Macrococcoides caseolyticum subsp. caseolyticum]|uniref:Alpha-amylase n=1 Tax=Macrococcus caseolyticus (strain JCSC5402) TaxID=458233 RepID=B9E9G6_MACCJ|nr:alpha-glucosidase [Macrococcus caseolyticus]PKE11895.1 alpha-glucosidase [Macrococcus caseolyticus]PKE49231.1 alpha-glucosidase [Macrococcus caseolyticus]PKF16325.1 alpha-glucosidase [Macrococcus caseolyticus]RAK45820.1 alpha-glucosidase [Macrococcus caseolyticus subsp. caseolyticus]BAH16877.1 alpha-glucosidase homolog [Macrococcus caseolyticus JCSC5402]
MNTRTWWKEAVCYQIYPRSFKDSNGDGIGDINGITEKLDYLKELGIDVIWVSPIFESPNDDNGYDISDYQEIMRDFGTMEDFDRLLYEVHARDMKLILDLVINHTSDEHSWFVESKKSKDNEFRDWYIWKDGKGDKEPNNWASIFEGSAWEYDATTNQYYMHVFSRKQPDLNWENENMRQAIYNMVNWWLDKGIDGFRVDAISHIKKSFDKGDLPGADKLGYAESFEGHMNQPGIQEHLQELKENTFDKYDIMTVGEANGVTIEDSDEWVGEENGKFNMVFQFEHLNLWDHNVGKSFDIKGYKDVLNSWQKGLENKGWNALFIENHDRQRVSSTWGDDEEYWYESSTSHAVVYFLQQGTPFIYQGQEIGMTNYPFEDIIDFDDVHAKNIYNQELKKGVPKEEVMEMLRRISRDNTRTPMQWDDTKNAGFTKGTPWLKVNPNFEDINVFKQEKDENSILNFYKQLIQLKKKHLTLTYGTFDLIYPEDTKVFAYTRTYEGDQFIIIGNLSHDKVTLKKDESLKMKDESLVLYNYQKEDRSEDIFTFQPFEARIYHIENR